VAVVLLVLIASAYLAPFASLNVILLPIGIVAVFVVLRRPILGLAALIIGSQFVPFSLRTGTETDLNFTVLMLVLLLAGWVVQMALQHDVRLFPSRPLVPLLLLVLVAAIATAVGTHSWLPLAATASIAAQLGGLAVFALAAGAFLLMAHRIPSERWLERLVWLFLASGALYAVSFVAPTPTLGQLFQAGSDSSLFWVWIVALASGQALFNRSLPWPVRLFALALALATLAVGFFLKREWTSSWLPSAVALGTLVWFRSKRLAVLAALLLVGALLLFPDLPSSIAEAKDYSTTTREDAAKIMLQDVFPISPLIGLGPSNYYWYVPLFPIRGYTVQFNSHNNYLDLLAQTGILGFACFLWFAGELGWLAWRLGKQLPSQFGKAYAYSVLGGLFGTLVSAGLGDWVLPFVYNIGLRGFRGSAMGWLFMGGLVALERLAVRGEKEDPAVRPATIGNVRQAAA
jgi:hypothetical protein